MRAITLWVPWGSAIERGYKKAETRPRRTPWTSAIGETIAVHQGVHIARLSEADDVWNAFTLDEYQATRSTENPRRFPPDSQACDPLPLGAVVATARVADVVPAESIGWSDCPTLGNHFGLDPVLDDACTHGWSQNHGCNTACTRERIFGDFTPGRSVLLLDNVEKVTPKPCRGYQGLWTLPPGVAAEIAEELA